MSDQFHDKGGLKDRNRFLAYGALSIALAVGFGYSMASIRHQDYMVQIAASNQAELNKAHEEARSERDSLHRRYTRQVNDLRKDKEALDIELKSILKLRAEK